ncbi:MAG: hypothetical protein K7J46_09070 [Bryobacter sp.]|jgi:hypothetical protein|nr:hypothetical protein [Bryobacter sp. CoA8 C33]
MRILALLPILAADPVTLDRLALSVGNEIITEQQILLHIRTAALLNGEPPRITPAIKRQAAQKLIELTLIRTEMSNNRYPLPSPAQVEQAFRAVLAQRFGGRAEALREACTQYRVGEAELRDSLLWQLATLSFIDFRFRPAIQITEQEIRDFYQQDYPDRLTRTLDQARSEILELLTQQRIDNLLDRWLNQTESTTRVRWIEGVFQ